VPQVDPDQEAALRRLRAAFGFVEVLEIIDHEPTQDPAGDQADEQAPSTDREKASARRRLLDPPEHDPEQLARVRPDNLVAGDPAGMLSRRVDLELLRHDHTVVAERAAPVQPGLAGVVVGEELGRRIRHLGLSDRRAGARAGGADSLAALAHQHREQALDLAERPGRGPAERAPRPHSAPLLPELLFD
jgi:hypothetical protein